MSHTPLTRRKGAVPAAHLLGTEGLGMPRTPCRSTPRRSTGSCLGGTRHASAGNSPADVGLERRSGARAAGPTSACGAKMITSRLPTPRRRVDRGVVLERSVTCLILSMSPLRTSSLCGPGHAQGVTGAPRSRAPSRPTIRQPPSPVTRRAAAPRETTARHRVRLR